MLTLEQSPIVTGARTEVVRSQGPQLMRGLTVEIVETVGIAVKGKCCGQAPVFLFDLILYIPSTIFQLCRDRSSWVEPGLS